MSITWHFDTLGYVEKAEKLGVPQELAKFQARKLEEAMEAMSEQTNKAIELATTTIKADIKDKDLATKGDIRESELRLQKEIAELRYATLKFIIWAGGGVVAIVLGGMFTMLKLMLHI